jgi:hypothetical protein
MNPLWLLAFAAGGFYVWSQSSHSGAGVASVPPASPPPASAADLLLAQQATATAQQFNAQAQALGLNAADAAQAAAIGLTPQEYVDSGLASSSMANAAQNFLQGQPVPQGPQYGTVQGWGFGVPAASPDFWGTDFAG